MKRERAMVGRDRLVHLDAGYADISNAIGYDD